MAETVKDVEAVGGVVFVGEQVVRLHDDGGVLVDRPKVVLRARQTAGCISPRLAARRWRQRAALRDKALAGRCCAQGAGATGT